ncbi:hypothetical protein M8J75_006355 [Diaphorina citri]|nr:hypothetical protein M8J75_006355 [Diaphorina citri]
MCRLQLLVNTRSRFQQVLGRNKSELFHSGSKSLPPIVSYLPKSSLICHHHLHTSCIRHKLIQFNLADIGEGIREVNIKEWNGNVTEGARINEFDVVCEVESDKASVTITSRYKGTVRKVYYGEGDVALVGKPLLDIEVEEEADSLDRKAAPGVSEVNTPDTSDQPNETLHKEPNKVNREPIAHKPDVTPDISRDSAVSHLNQPVNLNKNKWKILATPSVRRMIKHYEIDTKELRGTGKQGRVLKEDIITYMNAPSDETNPAHTAHVREASNVIPIRGYVKGMFKSMTEANTIPSLRLTEEVDTTQLRDVKNQVSALYQEKFGLKLTYMPFFIKALSLCMTEYPILNASIDPTQENILVNPDHNISIAIDTKHGLVVPNIKSVNKLSLLDITRELLRIQGCSHEGKVLPRDIQGGTISMSNVGNVGGTLVQPIIVPRQVCIVAFGKIQLLPRFDAEMRVVAKCILNVTWAADHRRIPNQAVSPAAGPGGVRTPIRTASPSPHRTGGVRHPTPRNGTTPTQRGPRQAHPPARKPNPTPVTQKVKILSRKSPLPGSDSPELINVDTPPDIELDKSRDTYSSQEY